MQSSQTGLCGAQRRNLRHYREQLPPTQYSVIFLIHSIIFGIYFDNPFISDHQLCTTHESRLSCLQGGEEVPAGHQRAPHHLAELRVGALAAGPCHNKP